MKTLGVNTKSDELQMGIMNCIKCGQVYRSNVVSATCPECKDTKHFDEIEEINKQVLVLQARRNNLEIAAIKENGYADWQVMNAAYLKWQGRK